MPSQLFFFDLLIRVSSQTRTLE